MELVIHRGSNELESENSLEGIAQCEKLLPACPIELDVAANIDGEAFVIHDLNLKRLCGLDACIYQLGTRELPKLLNGHNIPTLKEILDLFPEKKFLFDLRDDFHQSLFPEGCSKNHQTKPNIKKLLVYGLQKALWKRDPTNYRLMVATTKMHSLCSELFPKIPVDFSERSTRIFFDNKETDLRRWPLKPAEKRIYVRTEHSSNDFVNYLKESGFILFGTSSYSKRSLTNTRTMIQRAKELNFDGLIVSPIDQGLYAQAQKHENTSFKTN